MFINHGDVVELVDTHALGACASRREGSSPFIPTILIIVIIFDNEIAEASMYRCWLFVLPAVTEHLSAL